MDTMQIKVPSTREWKSLADVRKTYSDAEIVEIVHRYANQMDYRKDYRTRRNAVQREALKVYRQLMSTGNGAHGGTRVDMSADEEGEA